MRTDLEKLEFIHSTLQELDEGMIQDSIKFVEELREPLLRARENYQIIKETMREFKQGEKNAKTN